MYVEVETPALEGELLGALPRRQRKALIAAVELSTVDKGLIAVAAYLKRWG